MSSNVEAVEKLCLEYINGKSESNIPLILAKDISASNIDLLTIVEALGSWLTSKNDEYRMQGTKLLSNVLNQSTSHTYSSSEVQYLVMFYCDRLKDSVLVIPYVFHGLIALASHQNLSEEQVVSIVRTIFKEIHNQSLSHGTRRMIYTLLKQFLITHLNAIRQIGSEFLLGFIQAMDGEKDPRNLVLVFSIALIITKHLDISVLVEDLFEVLACYFPINFTPSATDPDSISKEELVEGLRNALVSTPQFAEFLIPILLEKLSSDLHGSKIDSLETMTAGAPVFGSIGMGPYLQDIWELIRKEVFQPVSEKVESTSLACLSAIVSCTNDSSALQQELSTSILKDCCHHIIGPESSLFKSATRLLLASSSGSPTMFTAIAGKVFPIFKKQLEQDIQSYKKVAILKVVKDFIEIRRTKKDFKSPDLSLNTLLQPLYPSVLTFISNDLPSSPSAALSVINEMLQVQGLSNDEVGMGCGDLLRLAFDTKDKSISNQCYSCLNVIGQLYTTVALEYVLPPLLIRLCRNGVNGSNIVTVTMIGAVSAHYDIIVASIPVLLDQLSSVSLECLSTGKVSLSLAVIDALKSILKTIASSSPNVLQYYSNRVIPHLLSTFISSTSIDNAVLSSSDVISSACDVIRMYTSLIDQNTRGMFLHNLMEAFSTGSLNTMLPHHQQSSSDNEFLPLNSSSPGQQTQLLSFISAAISPTQVFLDWSLVSQMFVSLIHFSLESPHSLSVDHAARGCGSIANRATDTSIIERELVTIWGVVCDNTRAELSRVNMLTMLLWICKGLLLRSHDLALIYTQKLLTLFTDELLGDKIATGFGTPLLSNSTDCLNAECNANIRLFHKQWYFSKMVPHLLSLYHSSVSVRSRTISVLSVLMQSIPKQVLLSELPKLLPLLLESINPSSPTIAQPDVLVSSLSAIQSLVEDAPVIIGSHVTSLVPHLLHISCTHSQMRVRIQSLKCLSSLTVLPTHIIYPSQREVVRQLPTCLDDKKRLVRREAVECRNRWFLIGVE